MKDVMVMIEKQRRRDVLLVMTEDDAAKGDYDGEDGKAAEAVMVIANEEDDR